MTYDYECKACQHSWEADQKITEEPLKTCPKCGADEAKRLISKGGFFQLKGSGWAADGYS